MKKVNGFTLFELLVSISIIAILTALATLSFSSAQKKARDSRRVQDLKAIQTAAEQYYSLNNYLYPENFSGTWTVGSTTVLEKYPSDPKGGTYTYKLSTRADNTTYCVCALMENSTAGNSGADCNFSATTHFCVKNQQ